MRIAFTSIIIGVCLWMTLGFVKKADAQFSFAGTFKTKRHCTKQCVRRCISARSKYCTQRIRMCARPKRCSLLQKAAVSCRTKRIKQNAARLFCKRYKQRCRSFNIWNKRCSAFVQWKALCKHAIVYRNRCARFLSWSKRCPHVQKNYRFCIRNTFCSRRCTRGKVCPKQCKKWKRVCRSFIARYKQCYVPRQWNRRCWKPPRQLNRCKRKPVGYRFCRRTPRNKHFCSKQLKRAKRCFVRTRKCKEKIRQWKTCTTKHNRCKKVLRFCKIPRHKICPVRCKTICASLR